MGAATSTLPMTTTAFQHTHTPNKHNFGLLLTPFAQGRSASNVRPAMTYFDIAGLQVKICLKNSNGRKLDPIAGYTHDGYACRSATVTKDVESSTPQRGGKPPLHHQHRIDFAMALAAAPSSKRRAEGAHLGSKLGRFRSLHACTYTLLNVSRRP